MIAGTSSFDMELLNELIAETKKMIVSQLIKQIRIGRDYEMEIDLNVNYEMSSGMLMEEQSEEANNMKESA